MRRRWIALALLSAPAMAGAIGYLDRILSSRQYKDALTERGQTGQ